MSETNARWAALRASWPPSMTKACGPFIWQDGAGGGNRVSAARLKGTDHAVTVADIVDIEARFDAAKRPATFQVQSYETHLNGLLDERRYQTFDATICMNASVQTLLNAFSGNDVAADVGAQWPPNMMQKDVWAAGGITDARLSIMERVTLKKTAVFSEFGGTAFVASSGTIAVVHALEVAQSARRRGVARALMKRAALWAHAHDAQEMALLVTKANQAAQALYSSLGMRECGRYHYRRKGDQ